MNQDKFSIFFQNQARSFLLESIDLALREDGQDLTSLAVFNDQSTMKARIVAKENTLVAGLPILPMVLDSIKKYSQGTGQCSLLVSEGSRVQTGTVVAEFAGTTALLLTAERVMLNFLSHLSGIANLVNKYVTALDGTGTKLLDTRKTLPGLRYPEKYAVLVGGGFNHRKNLEEMLMLKDNHIDAAGGITQAVQLLRSAYADKIRIEVECRNLAEVEEALTCQVSRVMLDNMSKYEIEQALPKIPSTVEVEISGGVTLDNIHDFARVACQRKPDYISVGRLTHSAKAADFSMQTEISLF